MGYDWKGCKLTAVVSSLYALSKTNDPKGNVHVFGTETRTS